MNTLAQDESLSGLRRLAFIAETAKWPHQHLTNPYVLPSPLTQSVGLLSNRFSLNGHLLRVPLGIA